MICGKGGLLKWLPTEVLAQKTSGRQCFEKVLIMLSQEKSKEERVRVPFVIFLPMTWNMKPVKEHKMRKIQTEMHLKTFRSVKSML